MKAQRPVRSHRIASPLTLLAMTAVSGITLKRRGGVEGGSGSVPAEDFATKKRV